MKVFVKKPVSLLLLLVTTIAYSGYAQSTTAKEQVSSVAVAEALNHKQAKTAEQEIKQVLRLINTFFGSECHRLNIK